MVLATGGRAAVRSRPVDASHAFDLRLVPVETRPFAHIVREGFLRPDLYAALSETFPDPPPSVSPSGHALYWGDPAYDQLLAEHACWRELFDACQSPAFVEYVLAQFADAFARCLVDLGRATFVRYQESRADKERRHLQNPLHRPEELWVRMDLHRGHRGYDRGIHVDHRRRLMTMLIYFCDAREARMLGGSLVLEPSALGFPRHRRKVVVPAKNRMAMFACSADSFHSVPPILFTTQHRRYIQIHLSSSVDVWAEPRVTAAERAARAVRESIPGRIVRRLARDTARARHARALRREGAAR